jgi:hypothetical protein
LRLVRPSAIVFAIALIASLGVHLPIYEALGVLVEVMAEREAALARLNPIAIEFTGGKTNHSVKVEETSQKEQQKSDTRQAEPVASKKKSPKPEPTIARPRSSLSIYPTFIAVFTASLPIDLSPVFPWFQGRLAIRPSTRSSKSSSTPMGRFIVSGLSSRAGFFLSITERLTRLCAVSPIPRHRLRFSRAMAEFTSIGASIAISGYAVPSTSDLLYYPILPVRRAPSRDRLRTPAPRGIHRPTPPCLQKRRPIDE